MNSPSIMWTDMIKLPRLRAARERAALSQGELAKIAGVSRVTVVRIESGWTIPTRGLFGSWLRPSASSQRTDGAEHGRLLQRCASLGP